MHNYQSAFVTVMKHEVGYLGSEEIYLVYSGESKSKWNSIGSVNSLMVDCR